MIKVNFETLNDTYVSLEVSGHANFADKGEDLVCAGVSSILIGAFNGFNELAAEHFDLTVEDNLLKAHALSNACIVDKLFSFVYWQLKTVEDQYSDFIKINVTEV